jgi:hypothetical protein
MQQPRLSLGLHKMIINCLHNAVAKRTSRAAVAPVAGELTCLRRECGHCNTSLSVGCGALHTGRENLKLNVKLSKLARPGVTTLFRAGEISQRIIDGAAALGASVCHCQRHKSLSVPLSEAQELQCVTVRGTRGTEALNNHGSPERSSQAPRATRCAQSPWRLEDIAHILSVHHHYACVRGGYWLALDPRCVFKASGVRPCPLLQRREHVPLLT